MHAAMQGCKSAPVGYEWTWRDGLHRDICAAKCGGLELRRATKKVQPVLGGFESANYHTERLWATAADGVRVPVSLVYHKRLAKLDGSDPLLLDGCAASSSLDPC